MNDEVPAGIRATIARWGRQKRRIWAGHGGAYVDSKGLRKVHVDGYAESFMGKLMEEREGCGQGTIRQRWEEVMWGDGLDVQRHIVGMPAAAFDAVHLQYVFDPEFGLTIERKARLIGMKRTAYTEAVVRGEWWLWARLEPGIAPDAQVVALIKKITKEALQCREPQTINAQDERVGPQLDLAALNRPTLKLAR
jgi:hypothetical protein